MAPSRAAPCDNLQSTTNNSLARFSAHCDLGTIQDLPQMIFAGINARIYAGALANSLSKSNCLIRPASCHRDNDHSFRNRAPAEHPDGRADGIGLRPGTGYNAKKMIGLADRISGVAIVIRAPEQARLQRAHLPIEIFRIALKPRIASLRE